MLEIHAGLSERFLATPQGSTGDACALMDKELGRAQRVASERFEPEDIRWLCKGFSAFLASGGKLSLERCLKLPANERALQRARRDYWLRAAWQLLDPAVSAWRRSELLAEEIRRFQAGKWARWSELGQPAADARTVDQALFEAFRSHQRVPATAMQLHNIASERRRG